MSLFSDGLREKEKKELFPLVKQVSQMKDNTYNLQRHIWNDVSEDWPYYTEEEKQTFRRRKPQNLTPPGSDGSTGSAASGHSSSSSHPASPQPSLKRPAPSSASANSYLTPGGSGGGGLGAGNGLVSLGDSSPDSHLMMPSGKRKRVSNFIRPGGGNGGISPMSSLGRSPPSRSPSTLALDSHVMSGESKTNAWLKTNQELHSSNSSSSSNGVGSIPAPSRFSTDDFLTKFTRIGSNDQRRVYKSEFNKDYNRYMVLHKQVDRVSQRFADLKRQLRNTPESSPDHDVSSNH